jgi:DHA1 family bicyclomycin/chloramphenicol resistance-like MFS transporter
MLGAVISRRIAGRMDLTRQVHMGLAITLVASVIRVLLHLTLDHVPIPLQQALLFCSAIGAQFAFPVLTLRMLDLFPAARGTAASAQSFVALLVTAFTLGIVAPKVLSHLEWIAWTSLLLTALASLCWHFARRWQRPLVVA